jgi:hypothetical protein
VGTLITLPSRLGGLDADNFSPPKRTYPSPRITLAVFVPGAFVASELGRAGVPQSSVFVPTVERSATEAARQEAVDNSFGQLTIEQTRERKASS